MSPIHRYINPPAVRLANLLTYLFLSSGRLHLSIYPLILSPTVASPQASFTFQLGNLGPRLPEAVARTGAALCERFSATSRDWPSMDSLDDFWVMIDFPSSEPQCLNCSVGGGSPAAKAQARARVLELLPPLSRKGSF